jgi:hypothetical protein
MKDNGSITSWEAFQELGVTRLSARIFELKKMGYRFSKRRMESINRYNEPIHYDRYTLEEVKNEETDNNNVSIPDLNTGV